MKTEARTGTNEKDNRKGKSRYQGLFLFFSSCDGLSISVYLKQFMLYFFSLQHLPMKGRCEKTFISANRNGGLCVCHIFSR